MKNKINYDIKQIVDVMVHRVVTHLIKAEKLPLLKISSSSGMKLVAILCKSTPKWPDIKKNLSISYKHTHIYA